jgi:hypothetical protein
MKKRYEDGGEIDALEAANKSEEAMDIADSMKRGAPGMSETVKATPKAMPKAMPKAAPKPAPKAESKPTPKPAIKASDMPADESKMSLADRMKMSRERARSGSGTTDTRSVGERLRSAFAGKDRGGNTVDFGGSGMGMKRGGSVKPSKMGAVKQAKPSYGSASSRADGIASKGKTRGKFI